MGVTGFTVVTGGPMAGLLARFGRKPAPDPAPAADTIDPEPATSTPALVENSDSTGYAAAAIERFFATVVPDGRGGLIDPHADGPTGAGVPWEQLLTWDRMEQALECGSEWNRLVRERDEAQLKQPKKRKGNRDRSGDLEHPGHD